VRIRAATADDARVLAEIAGYGFQSYREFGPASYEPPDLEYETTLFREALATPEYWCQIAEDDEGPVAEVGFRRAEIEPGLVHFQRLFLLPRAFGTGLAGQLMGLAVEEMHRNGYERARLFTPAGHARARRFYEREGWQVRGEPFPEPRLGNLPVVEYRLDLR
jgi:GNAT superfamily N-acetyltransferase